MIYIVGFLLSLGLSLLLMPLALKFSVRFGFIDNPEEADRKIHRTVMPRAGGLVLWLVFMLVSFALLQELSRAFWGLAVSSTIVFLVGLWDDAHRLPAWLKLIFQLIAALVAVLGFGLGVNVVSNPLGAAITLGGPTINVLNTTLSLGALLFSVVWLVGVTNTVNFLDGIDGLAGGVSAIAGLVLFLVSLLPRINQPSTALLAIIVCGVCLGFLRYNFHPARIFLGDSGAYFLGMMLGGLAIISGAKLATALLVLGLPVLDAVWAVIRRLASGRSPFSADRDHVHYLLLDAGLSQRQVALLIYLVALTFGLVALIASGAEKLVALVILVGCVALGIVFLTMRRRAAH